MAFLITVLLTVAASCAKGVLSPSAAVSGHIFLLEAIEIVLQAVSSSGDTSKLLVNLEQSGAHLLCPLLPCWQHVWFDSKEGKHNLVPCPTWWYRRQLHMILDLAAKTQVVLFDNLYVTQNKSISDVPRICVTSLKFCGVSFHSVSSLNCLDRRSAWTFTFPGMCVTVNHMLFSYRLYHYNHWPGRPSLFFSGLRTHFVCSSPQKRLY